MAKKVLHLEMESYTQLLNETTSITMYKSKTRNSYGAFTLTTSLDIQKHASNYVSLQHNNDIGCMD
jgi:hypothetical protein